MNQNYVGDIVDIVIAYIGYLASSFHSLVHFLQEVSLPAPLGVADGGGIGGL